MSNMSYCRFRNTLSDLRDCWEHLERKVEEDEHRARKCLIQVAYDILQEAESHGWIEEIDDLGRDLEWDQEMYDFRLLGPDEEEDED